MTFSVIVECTAPYLVISATGPARLTELCALTRFAGELCEREGQAQFLADLSGVSPSLSFTDHLHLASLMKETYALVLKVAVVVPDGFLESPAEKAANRWGLTVRTFPVREAATAWLESS